MEDEDTHICLVCHTTVIGLDNYVRHKKKECAGRKTQTCVNHAARREESGPTKEVTTVELSPLKEENVSSRKEQQPSIPVSSTSMSPGTSRTIDSNMIMYDGGSPKDISITDFLSSLELQSIGRVPEQPKADKDNQTTDKSPNIEERLDDHKSLRIANILSDLAFSDDDEDNEDDLPNIDTENLMSLVEDDDHHPPRSHTGGKWRPGTAPPPGGKWKPSGKLLAMSKNRHNQNKQSSGKRMPGVSIGKRMPEEAPDTEPKIQDQYIELNDGDDLDNDLDTEKYEGTDTTHDNSMKLSCQLCNRNFKREGGLTRHLLTNYHIKRAKTDSDTPARVPAGKPNELDSSTQCSTAVLECPTCDKKFNSKYNFGRHLVSSYHQKRSGKDTRQFLLNESLQTLLLRQNPYQCRVCNFYCFEYHVFVDHMEQNSHKQRVTQLIGPLLCRLCRFFTRNSDEMLEHFLEKPHTVRKGGRPCIIKEKRHLIKCPQCDLEMHSATALRRHLKFVHSGKGRKIIRSGKGIRVRPTCPQCDLRCASESALDLHIRRIHDKQKKYNCDICHRSFSDRHTLGFHNQSRYHYRRAAEAAGISLREFLENAKSDDSLRNSATSVLNDIVKKKQKRKNDAGSEDFNCKTCGMTFPSVQNLKLHIKSQRHRKMMQTAESGNIVECPTCSQKFDSPNSYVSHEMKAHINIVSTDDGKSIKHTGIDEKYMDFVHDMEKSKKTMVKCPECSKQIRSGNIYVHLRNHSNSKPFNCKLCNLKFSDHNLLKHHVVCVHMQLKNFTCSHCGKGYSRSSHYHRHLREAHSNLDSVEQYPCKTCGKVFKDLYRVHQHERTVHSVKANVCPWEGCYRKFTTPYSLKVHMRTHTGEKPFLCQLCGFSCPDVSGMARHKRTHRAREYPCDYCTYKGTTRAHLKRHLRIHIGSKPYRCLHCDYRCNTVENLRKHCVHNKVHVGKFMYPCKHCTYGTHSAKDMQTHLLLSHSVSVENDKHVGMYLGTYEKEEDPDELPEGSCAIPVTERKRVSKQAVPNREEEFVGLISTDPIVTVIIKTNPDKSEGEILTNLDIRNVESVTDLFKAVESVKLEHAATTNSEGDNNDSNIMFVESAEIPVNGDQSQSLE